MLARAGEGALLLEHGFRVDVQPDLVAHDDAAAFEYDVPLEAPVLTADLGGRAESGALVAPRRADRAEVLELERDRPGHVLDREVADEPIGAVARVLDLGRAERRGGMVLGVAEVRAAEVLVAGGVATVDVGDVDGRLDRRVERVRGDRDAAAGEREATTHLGHHEVAGRERDVGVARVERPGAGGRQLAYEGGLRYSHCPLLGSGAQWLCSQPFEHNHPQDYCGRKNVPRGGRMETWATGPVPRWRGPRWRGRCRTGSPRPNNGRGGP